MHGINSLAALAGLAGLAIASPIENEKRTAATSFVVSQVAGTPVLKTGPIALSKALAKFNGTVPARVATAVRSGAVTASPEQYDSEYLCPVNVGGTVLNLDFDTGSSDL